MLDAGSFSDANVVQATRDFVRVMVNCTAPGREFEKTAEGSRLMKQYKVKVWPTVIFLDPEGKPVDRFTSCKKPDFVVNKLKRLRKRYPPALAKWDGLRALVGKLEHRDPKVRREAAVELRRVRAALAAAQAGFTE